MSLGSSLWLSKRVDVVDVSCLGHALTAPYPVDSGAVGPA